MKVLEDMIKAKVWIVCECGRNHRLLKGLHTPVYYCGKDVKHLKEGDEVECK